MSHYNNLKLTKPSEGEAEVTGEITLEFLAECRAEAIKHLGEHVEVSGFRKGHIPEDVLVKKVGDMRVLEEAAEIALGREYPRIIEELKLSPLGRPRISILKLAPGIPLEFKINVSLEPEFELPDYKKLASGVEKPALKEDAKDDEKFWAREKRRAAIIEALIKATEIALPQPLVDAELDRTLQQMREDVAKHGMKWEEYLKSIDKSEEDVRAEFTERAKNRAKAEMIMVKIAEAEKIEPSIEELEAEAKHLLEHHPGADPLRVRLYVFQLLRNSKVLEFLETQ